MAPLGPPGGLLGSKCLPEPCLDPPRTLQETLLEAPGADLGSNLSQLGAKLRSTWSQLRAKLSQVGIKIACGSDLMLKQPESAKTIIFPIEIVNFQGPGLDLRR